VAVAVAVAGGCVAVAVGGLVGAGIVRALTHTRSR
jgi:hypothetical protein